MNKLFKRVIAFAITVAMVLTLAVVTTPAKAFAAELEKEVELTAEAGAAEVLASEIGIAGKPYFSSEKYASTYNPYDNFKGYYAYVSPSGVTGTPKITNLKSSSRDISAEVTKYGSIKVSWKNKACKAKISCKVNGVALSFKLYIYKYSSPFEAVKIGSKSYVKLFDRSDSAKTGKTYSKSKLTVKCKSDWAITSISVYTNGKYKNYNFVDSRKGIIGVRKATIGNFYINAKSYAYIYAVNVKTGVRDSWRISYK